MGTIHEQENKYLVDDVTKNTVWDKEQIVYQWYTGISKTAHTKEKLIFDLLNCRIIYVRIGKMYVGPGEANKNVEYLDIDSFNVDQMTDIPFVMKRRSIKDHIFLDRMIRSNGICEYLLEDEDDDLSKRTWDEFRVTENVTDRVEYYNQNMCTPFTTVDAQYLKFLLQSFR